MARSKDQLARRIRFDGIYWGGGECLRFYRDRRVSRASYSGNDLTTAADFSRRSAPGAGVGTWTFEDGKLSFTIELPKGKIDYWGAVEEAGLRLSSRSHITGYESEDELAFHETGGDLHIEDEVDMISTALAEQTLSEARVRVAADVGHMPSRLALYPVRSLEDVAATVHGVGGEATARFMLGLVWHEADERLLRTQKDGEDVPARSATRKAIKALEKWLEKPAEKQLQAARESIEKCDEEWHKALLLRVVAAVVDPDPSAEALSTWLGQFVVGDRDVAFEELKYEFCRWLLEGA